MSKVKEIFIIAGPNGAGKTTFALGLIDEGIIKHYLNADEIAREISPEDPQKANVKAARIFLQRLRGLSSGNTSFAFETTLSGLRYLKHIEEWRESGWLVSVFYLLVSSPEVSKQRVIERVEHGGHNIPSEDIERRFPKSLVNFYRYYSKQVNYAECLYNENQEPMSIFERKQGQLIINEKELYTYFMELIHYAESR
ncbi:zeta toxin family protein [Marinomonas sp. A79]|uniref:Zeta toxin family protein n=1 Tax=Marinomonas vulgaris TaxID=2823372 RepID=A0ABS5H813_9GAMM|nr:zeta toxin family protein [Marinomonas vulgaris]MBR7887567.1 zeta toxin family protein [Marinomonas vulgaris]